MTVSCWLSAEERTAPDLVSGAARAEQAGFPAVLVSDHYMPWLSTQAGAPFVWSALGGMAAVTSTVRLATGVTCPTFRYHPALVAQMAATVATLAPGRFSLGVGSGEALNEHVYGQRWPGADERLARLEEAVALIRQLWTGEQVTHVGAHYTVDRARLVALPKSPPPILVSALGAKAIDVAARIGDGLFSVEPDAHVISAYREAGGRGLASAVTKVCYGPDADACKQLAHKLWAFECLPGELPRELPTTAHFDQAVQLVNPDQVAAKFPCGPDVDAIVEHLRAYLDAGYDEVYVAQIGPDEESFYKVFERQILPELNRRARTDGDQSPDHRQPQQLQETS